MKTKRQITKQELEELADSKQPITIMFPNISLKGVLINIRRHKDAYSFVSQLGDDIISQRGTFLPAEAENGLDYNDTRLIKEGQDVFRANIKGDGNWTLYYHRGTRDFDELAAYLKQPLLPFSRKNTR